MAFKRIQQGLTLSGLIMACILLGFAALTAMKLFPLYNEKTKVDFALENVAGTPGSANLSKNEAVTLILKQFEVSDVDRFQSASLRQVLEIEKPKGSATKVMSMQYEIRGPFYGDLDIVLKYSNTVELRDGGGE